MNQQLILKDHTFSNELKLYIQLINRRLEYVLNFIRLMKSLRPNANFTIGGLDPYKISYELNEFYKTLDHWKDDDWRFILNECIDARVSHFRILIIKAHNASKNFLMCTYNLDPEEANIMIEYSKEVKDVLSNSKRKQVVFSVDVPLRQVCFKDTIKGQIFATIKKLENIMIIEYNQESGDIDEIFTQVKNQDN